MYDDFLFPSRRDIIWYSGVAGSFGFFGPHSVPFFPKFWAIYARVGCDDHAEKYATRFIIVRVMLTGLLTLA